MRRALALSLALPLTAACGGTAPLPDAGAPVDAPPARAHARLAWQVRCEGSAACDEPPVRTVDASDGEGGATVACDLSTNADGTARRLSFTVDDGAGHAVRVRGATVGLDGDRLQGTGCVLSVDEASDYALEGPCGPNPPTADAPCQLQRLDVALVDGMPTFRAELRCAGLVARDAAGVTRGVSGPASATAFASLDLSGCAGL